MKRQQDPLAPRASSHMHLLSSHVLCPATKLLPRLHLPMSQMHRTLSRVWILASFSNMVGEGRTKTLIWSTWTRTHISFSRMQPMHTFPSTLHYSHFEASPKSPRFHRFTSSFSVSRLQYKASSWSACRPHSSPSHRFISKTPCHVPGHTGEQKGATPKGILKIMDLPGLTIYHVKSHLQKYRISKFSPESFDKRKLERRKVSEILPDFGATSGAQISEAIDMHMEFESRLRNQLEVQRHPFSLKIEAQRRYLEKMTEEYKFLSIDDKPHRPSKSLPSLCEESESDTREYTSDSEADVTRYVSGLSKFTELSREYSSSYGLQGSREKDTSSEEIQAHKRQRAVEKFFQVTDNSRSPLLSSFCL